MFLELLLTVGVLFMVGPAVLVVLAVLWFRHEIRRTARADLGPAAAPPVAEAVHVPGFFGRRKARRPLSVHHEAALTARIVEHLQREAASVAAFVSQPSIERLYHNAERGLALV